jgi:6-phosphogluconolactonase
MNTVHRLTFLLLCFYTGSCFSQDYFLFAGSYTDSKPGKGIYVYKFNAESGNLKLISSVDGLTNPSWITLSPDGKYLYACTETKMKGSGNVSAFSFNRKTGKLKFINKQYSGGENPVYLSVHGSGRWLVNASYTEGNISVLPVKTGGSLQPFSQLVTFKDSSIIKERQEKSHPHAAVFSPDQRYVCVPDLGADKLRIFNVGDDNKSMLKEEYFVNSVPGSGPRHFVFHPKNNFAYCIEELSGTISSYTFSNGKLDATDRVAAHEADQKGPFGSADIHISPDGKFLYASNRGTENNIAVFEIDGNSGKLKNVGYESVKGESPRNFTIDPTGNFLLVANVASGNIVVFKRDPVSGLLKANGISVEVKSPSCLQWLKCDQF